MKINPGVPALQKQGITVNRGPGWLLDEGEMLLDVWEDIDTKNDKEAA